jgi:hypothetical protein
LPVDEFVPVVRAPVLADQAVLAPESRDPEEAQALTRLLVHGAGAAANDDTIDCGHDLVDRKVIVVAGVMDVRRERCGVQLQHA